MASKYGPNYDRSKVSALALLAFGAGRLADSITTINCLETPGFYEANVPVRLLMDSIGVTNGLIVSNDLAVASSYILAKGVNRCFSSSFTSKLGDLIFLYGGGIISSSVALSNQLRLYNYI